MANCPYCGTAFAKDQDWRPLRFCRVDGRYSRKATPAPKAKSTAPKAKAFRPRIQKH